MISIIIPLYNKEKSIVLTMESVFAQTYTDWELIIVDDGSTDNSLEVVQEYVREKCTAYGVRCKVISQKNAGVSAARNAGIMAAKGEYVTFIDADDLWTPDYLETITALMADYPGAGLYCTGYRVISSQTAPSAEQLQRLNSNRTRGYVDAPWSNSLRLYVGSVCGRKQKMIDCGLFDTRMTHGEDYDFCWRMMLDGGLARDSKCCAFYRQDSENRAMHRFPPLDKMIAYYIDKYADARAKNRDFRRFFDEQMIYRLYPYRLSKQYAKDAMRLARQLDYSQLKWSLHFRMLFPRTYYYIRKYLR